MGSNDDLNSSHRLQVAPSESSSIESSAKLTLSCSTCRERKVKCDKSFPCSPCKLRNFDCTPFIRPPSVRRKSSQRDRRAEFERRLGLLEGKLGGMVKSLDCRRHDETMVLSTENNMPSKPRLEKASLLSLNSSGRNTVSGDSDGDDLGQSFWVGLSEEFKEVQSCISQSNQQFDRSSSNQYVHGQTSQPQDLPQLFHIPTDTIRVLVDIYFSRVDPVLKMLERETIWSMVTFMSAQTKTANPTNECLLFAIFYASIASLAADTCVQLFGFGQDELLVRYQHDTEMALRRAELSNNTELFTLQALIIYLSTARLSDSSRSVWTWTALATRTAYALQLHKEFGITAVVDTDREVRRRTWWQVCHLEWRASVDRGSDPAIHEHNFNTALPINIDDVNFTKDVALVEVSGWTDMTFSLLVFETCVVASMLNYVPAKASIQFKLLSLKQRYEIAEEHCQHLQVRYLIYCDPSVPFQRFVLLAGKIISCRTRISVYYPLQRLNDPPVQSMDTRDSILNTAIELLETRKELENDKELSPWIWLSKTHVPWHAFAIVLAELCVRPGLSRAWRIVNETFLKSAERVADSEGGAIWQPLLKLFSRAQSARQQSVGRETAVCSESGSSDNISLEGFAADLTKQCAFPSYASQHTGTTWQDLSEPVIGNNADIEMTTSPSKLDPYWIVWEEILNSVEDCQTHDICWDNGSAEADMKLSEC